jgi:hypothetical protein
MTPKSRRLIARVDPTLYLALESAARRDRRSISNFVGIVLAGAIEAENDPHKRPLVRYFRPAGRAARGQADAAR